MVSVVLKSYTALVHVLREIRTTGASTDEKMEAVGLHKAITEWSFEFLTSVMHKVLDPANRMLQAKETSNHRSSKCLLLHRESMIRCIISKSVG